MRRAVPIVVYTDGSYRWKLQCGGWAAVIIHEGEIQEISGAEMHSSNNRMELMGPIKALQSIAAGANVYVFTDSQYVKKGVSIWMYGWKRRNWLTFEQKPVLNMDLWQLLDIEQSRHMVSWHWVRGHDGDLYNERCDQLAKEAANAHYQLVSKKAV